MSSFEHDGEPDWVDPSYDGHEPAHEDVGLPPADGYPSSDIVRESEYADAVIAPQTADELFEAFIHYPDTPEDRERITALDETEALQWLGGNGYHPALLFQFAAPVDIPEAVSSDDLKTYADAIAYSQLVNFSHSFATTNDGVAATDILHVYTTQDVDEPLIACSDVPQAQRFQTFRAGQFLVLPQENGDASVTLSRARSTSHGQDLIQYNTPNGEIHFIDPEGQTRYRFTTGENGPSMVKEQTVALNAEDPGYFLKLHQLLGEQHEILRHVAFEAGINPRSVDGFESLTLKGGFTPNMIADAEMNTFLQNRGPTIGLASRLVANTFAITDMVRRRRIPSPVTHQLERSGLLTVASRVQRYYAALRAANPPDKS